MEKVTLSSLSHSARRSGCTLVVNLKPAFSFIRTIPAGTEALTGDIILQIPENEASAIVSSIQESIISNYKHNDEGECEMEKKNVILQHKSRMECIVISHIKQYKP